MGDLIIDSDKTLGDTNTINAKRRQYTNVIIKNDATGHLYNMDIDVMNVEEGSSVHIYGTLVRNLIGNGMVYRHTMNPISTSTIQNRSEFTGDVKDVQCGLW